MPPTQAELLHTAIEQARPKTGPVASLLNLIFPPRCLNCGRVDDEWCAHCREAYAQIQRKTIVPVIPEYLDDIAVVGTHTGQRQKLVQALKYQNETWIAKVLGTDAAAHACWQQWQVDGIIPVPLHATRQHERGYNQSKLIAQVIGEIHDLPILPSVLQRVSFTQPQVGLSRKERLHNVKNAFRVATDADVQGRRLVLIDDVMTTGATLNACATALKKERATAVYGFTVTTAP